MTGPIAADQIKGFADRINNLLDEKQTVAADVTSVYDEAKKAGVNTKALRKVITKRRAKPADPEVEAAMEAYELALDAAVALVSNGSTSLRKASEASGFSKSAIQRQVSHRKQNAGSGTASDTAAERPSGGGAGTVEVTSDPGSVPANPIGQGEEVGTGSATDDARRSTQAASGEVLQARLSGKLPCSTTEVSTKPEVAPSVADPLTPCGCIMCTDARSVALQASGATVMEWAPGPGLLGWRYACEICGNKRCPHHSNHLLACTNSNEPGQPGSSYPAWAPPTVEEGAVAEPSPARVAEPESDDLAIPSHLRGPSPENRKRA